MSALNYAWQLLMLPHGVLALSVSTVILPTLSRLWQQGDTAAFRATLGERAAATALSVASGGGDPVRLSRADCADPLPDGRVLGGINEPWSRRHWHSWPPVSSATRSVEALTRAFYAMHDTRTPVIAGIAIIVLNIVIGVALLDRMGYLALALALSVSTTVEAVILATVLGRRIGGVTAKFAAWLRRVIARHASWPPARARCWRRR